ncbi:MAG: GNAT family protein [Dehalococcoidia bacterium]
MPIANRIRLRALEESDADAVWRWHKDFEMSLLDGWRYPSSLAQTAEWLKGVLRPEFENCFLAVEDETGELIGCVSLKRASAENREANFGIGLRRQSWKQGYGTAATLATLDHAFQQMNLHRVQLTVLDYNARASRAYLKAGFREEGRLRQSRFHAGHWCDEILMGILADEWRSIGRT